MSLRVQAMLRHVYYYWVLTRWLLGRAIWWHPYRIPAGLVFSIMSVAAEMVAFYLIVHVLHTLNTGAGLPAELFDAGYVDWLPPVVLMCLPAVAFILAGVLTYLSRSNSIEVQSSVARRLSDEVLQSLASHLSFYDRLKLPQWLDESELVQVALNDTAACGTAVRLSMLHFISFVYLIVGLGILAALAPPLLALWLGALVVIVPAIYIINLRALREAQDLGEVGPALRRSMTRYLRFLIDARQPRAEMEHDLRRRYLGILSSRLRIVEISRLTLSAVFAVAVTVFLIIVQSPEMRSLVNIGYLLFLFLAFRYTYQGVQGLSILVTTINRSLPSIIRTHRIHQRMERLAQGAASSARGQAAEATFSLSRIAWALERNGQQAQGAFEPGKAYGLVVPVAGQIASIGQVLDLVTSRAGRTHFMLAAGAQPAVETFVDSHEEMGIEARHEWIKQIVKSVRRGVTPEEIDAAIEGRSEGSDATLRLAARMAARIHSIGQSPPRIVILDGNLLSSLRVHTQRVLLEKLRPHIVFGLTNRLHNHLDNNAYDNLLISSGRSVAMVIPAASQVTDEMREQARLVFGSDRGRRDGAGSLDDDDTDEIAGLV